MYFSDLRPDLKEKSLSGVVALRDVLVLFFYYRVLIGVCLGAGLLIGCVAAILTPSVYPAESLLLLRPDAQSSAVSSGDTYNGFLGADLVQRMIASDVAIVGSDPVLRAAAAKGANPPPAGDDKAMERAVKTLRKRLAVAAEPGSNIIRVTYSDPDRDAAIRTLSALIQAYADQRSSVYATSVGDLQGRELQTYAAQLRSLGDQIESTKAQAGVLDIGQDIQLASGRLDGLMLSAAQAHQHEAAIKAQLQAASRELAHSPPLVLDSQESSNARANDEIVNTLARLRQQRQHVAEQYTESWPGLRDLDAQIAAAVAQLRAGQQQTSLTVRQVRNPVVDQAGQKASSLRIELQAVTAQIAQIEQAIADAQDRIAKLRAADARLHDLQRARDVMESGYKQLSLNMVDARLRDRVLDDRNGSVHVMQPASAPAKPLRRWPLLILGGLMLGAIAAAVACTVATLARQEFITPEEASRNLALPVIGETPDPADSGEGFRREAAFVAELVAEATVKGRPLKSLRVVATDDSDRMLLAEALAESLVSSGQGNALIVDFSRDGVLRSATGGDLRRLPDAEGGVVVGRTHAPRVWTAVSGHLGGAATLPAVFAALSVFNHLIVIGDDDSQGQKTTRRAYQLVDANLLVVRASDSRAPVLRHLREAILGAGGDLLGLVFLGRRFYIPERIYRWL